MNSFKNIALYIKATDFKACPLPGTVPFFSLSSHCPLHVTHPVCMQIIHIPCGVKQMPPTLKAVVLWHVMSYHKPGTSYIYNLVSSHNSNKKPTAERYVVNHRFKEEPANRWPRKKSHKCKDQKVFKESETKLTCTSTRRQMNMVNMMCWHVPSWNRTP